MKTLSRNVSEIGFFERKKVNGKYVINKCGRDFLYYALNFYRPNLFNSTTNNPNEVDKKKLFGTPLPTWLAWTMIPLARAPKFFKSQGLQVVINEKKVSSFIGLLDAILFSRKSYVDAIQNIEQCVDGNIACGIDLSIGLGGLWDHIVFVYGYDEESLYICDTHTALVEKLHYEKMPEGVFLFKLSKSEIKKRWTRFGRVWKVQKLV